MIFLSPSLLRKFVDLQQTIVIWLSIAMDIIQIVLLIFLYKMVTNAQIAAMYSIKYFISLRVIIKKVQLWVTVLYIVSKIEEKLATERYIDYPIAL